MLEIAAHAFGFESGPDDILHHAIALLGPFKRERDGVLVGMWIGARSWVGRVRTLWELVFVGFEFLLEFTHVGGVFVEEYLEQEPISVDFYRNIQKIMRLTVP